MSRPDALRALVDHWRTVAGKVVDSGYATATRLCADELERALLSGGGDDTAVVADFATTGWSGWATQYPGKMPRLFGQRWIAEMNWYPHERDGHALIRLVEVERIESDAAMSTTPEPTQ